SLLKKNGTNEISSLNETMIHLKLAANWSNYWDHV
ncbi:MAG: hypothetical protein ACI8Q6_000429, partial [Granulosicoccus sp.]